MGEQLPERYACASGLVVRRELRHKGSDRFVKRQAARFQPFALHRHSLRRARGGCVVLHRAPERRGPELSASLAERDVSGRAHPVMADVGCRNTVFGAEAQEASLHIDRWKDAGILHFRIEFVHESSQQVTRVTRAFTDYFNGRTSAGELNAIVQRISPQGTTEGSLYVPKDYLTLPVLQ